MAFPNNFLNTGPGMGAKKKKDELGAFQQPARAMPQAPQAAQAPKAPEAQAPQIPSLQQAREQTLQQPPTMKRPADLQAPATIQKAPPVLPATMQPPSTAPAPAPAISAQAFQKPALSATLQPLIRPEAAPAPSLAPRLEGMLSPLVQPPAPMEGGVPSLPQLGELGGGLPPKPQLGPLSLPQLGNEVGPSGPQTPNLSGLLDERGARSPLTQKPTMQALPELVLREPTPKQDTPANVLLRDEIRNVVNQPVLSIKIPNLGGAATPAPEAGPTTATGGEMSSGASRFVNFDRILSANLPGATEMSQKALGEAASRAEQATKDVSTAGTKFAEEVAKGTNVFTPGTFVQATGPQESYTTTDYSSGEPVQTQRSEGLEGIPQKQEDGSPVQGTGLFLDEAQRRAAQGYAGPEQEAFFTTPEYKQAQESIRKGEEAAKAMGTETGLEALLNQMYGTAGGTGASRLDMALARAAGGPKYRQATERFKNINTLLGDAAQKAQQDVLQAKATTLASQNQYKEAIGQGLSAAEVENARQAQIAAERQAEEIRKAAEWRQRQDRADDLRRKRSAGDSTRPISEEAFAARQGMTLEEWLAAGRPGWELEE